MTLRAFFVGMVGAGLFAVVSAVARAFGVAMDLEWMQGSFFLGPADAYSRASYGLGLALQFLAGGVFGVLHAMFLVRLRVSLLAGAVLGTMHAMMAGLALGSIAPIHPAIPEAIAAPGMFMVRRGRDAVIVFVAMHMVFGMLMSLLAVSRRSVMGPRLA